MKFHFWHTTLSLFFAAVAVFAYLWLEAVGRLPALHAQAWQAGLPTGAGSVSLVDFLLMTLAIARLVRLFTYDNITAFVREWFAEADPRSFMGSLGTLINCPWCTGLWFSLVVAFAYFATPIAWYAILVLALSSLASSFQLLTSLIGWHAEAKKIEAQSRSSL